MDEHTSYCPYCMHILPAGSRICPKCGREAGQYTSPPRHLPPGTILHDRYVIGAAMGEGGFGITYIGYDPVLQIKAAIKEYFPIERCTRDAFRSPCITLFAGVPRQSYLRGKELFLAEARILAKMDKQQVIVNVRDYFEENNTAYIVMEYIEGTTFTQLVKEQKEHGRQIPPGELLSLVEPLFGALSALHHCGLIHRDICPDNLMLENGQIRLLDFGCARDTACLKDTLTITLRHGYAPIEQYQQGGGQGPWTDIYALCATLYFCLTGVTPPVSTSRIVKNILKSPRSLGVHLLPEQEKALLKGLQLRPHRRYKDVEDLYRALYRTGPDPRIQIMEHLPVPAKKQTTAAHTAEKASPPSGTPSASQKKDCRNDQKKNSILKNKKKKIKIKKNRTKPEHKTVHGKESMPGRNISLRFTAGLKNGITRALSGKKRSG